MRIVRCLFADLLLCSSVVCSVERVVVAVVLVLVVVVVSNV